MEVGVIGKIQEYALKNVVKVNKLKLELVITRHLLIMEMIVKEIQLKIYHVM